MKDQSLEGLRGAAAMVVVLSHISLTFWPTTHTNTLPVPAIPWQVALFDSPLTFLYSGTLAVCIFFVMSGYVLSVKFWHTRDRSIIANLFKRRYIRLMFPVLASILLGYGLLKSGLIFVHASGSPIWISWTYTIKPSLIGALSDGLWRAFVVDGVQAYNPVVWTMKIEFLGSLLTFAFCIVAERLKFRGVIYLATALLCIKYLNGGVYYCLFLSGIWLGEIKRVNIGALTCTVLLAFAFWIGGYYEGSWSHVPMDSINLTLMGTHIETYQICAAIGGFIIVFVTLSNSVVAWALSRLGELGRRSFSIYLIHFPVLASLGMWIYLHLVFRGQSHDVAAIAATFVTIVASYTAAGFFSTYVDQKAISVSRNVSDSIGSVFRRDREKAAGVV